MTRTGELLWRGPSSQDTTGSTIIGLTLYLYVCNQPNISNVVIPFLFVLRNSYFSSTTCLPIPPHAILASEDIEDQTDPVIIRCYIYEDHFPKFKKNIMTVSSYSRIFLSSRAG